MMRWTTTGERYGLDLRIGKIALVFRLRKRYSNLPTMCWWRIGPIYSNGPGWYVRWRIRPSDFRLFSERQGHIRYHRIGPIEYRRLAKSGD